MDETANESGPLRGFSHMESSFGMKKLPDTVLRIKKWDVEARTAGRILQND